jgi:hypothetical protein
MPRISFMRSQSQQTNRPTPVQTGQVELHHEKIICIGMRMVIIVKHSRKKTHPSGIPRNQKQCPNPSPRIQTTSIPKHSLLWMKRITSCTTGSIGTFLDLVNALNLDRWSLLWDFQWMPIGIPSGSRICDSLVLPSSALEVLLRVLRSWRISEGLKTGSGNWRRCFHLGGSPHTGERKKDSNQSRCERTKAIYFDNIVCQRKGSYSAS